VVGINAEGLQTPESEASDIAKLVGSDPLLGEAATSWKVREGLHKSRIIHVATHGSIDSENTYRSYLLLANGRFEAWDLFRQAENADLIVFSACDTRRGPRQYMASVSSDDDSLSGLASRAGNRRILSSL
jgi:CHAT domain-containing protein